MEPIMLTPNRASAHNHRGGTVRKFERLLPVLLVLVLLAGVASAFTAGSTRISPNSSSGSSQSQFVLRFNQAPSTMRLDFGTVVRDTADDQSVGPGRWQAPQTVSGRTSFFIWNWFCYLITK
jgi:hypothetical protein